ncbi:MAG: LolA family protein, partial [Candidatus Dormibacteraceae bacterium]
DNVARFGLDARDLDAVLARASKCGTPSVTGTATVAGRSTDVIDLVPSKCPDVSTPELNGPSTIWVDQETFFVLKEVQYSGTDGKLLSTTEVTSIQYNVPVAPARFSFTPPPGARIEDDRPKPTPAADQYQQRLAQLARQVDFPLFVPRATPSGLVPVQPRLDDTGGPQVQLSYVPPDEAGKATSAGSTGVQITEQKASYDLIDRTIQQAQPTTVSGGQGGLRRGRQIRGGGSDSAAIVLRGGTLISVTSVAVSADDLLRIAGSLEPVSGSHPPLPDPTPSALAEIRQRVSFSVFVPTWVPAGLTPEPPVGGAQPAENVAIRYHTADGGVGLIVSNGTPDCCPGYAMLPSEPIALPDGLQGHLIRRPTTQYGGLTLWWQQDGTTVTLTGPAVSESDLVKIAASVSKTANP